MVVWQLLSITDPIVAMYGHKTAADVLKRLAFALRTSTSIYENGSKVVNEAATSTNLSCELLNTGGVEVRVLSHRNTKTDPKHTFLKVRSSTRCAAIDTDALSHEVWNYGHSQTTPFCLSSTTSLRHSKTIPCRYPKMTSIWHSKPTSFRHSKMVSVHQSLRHSKMI